VGGRAEEAHASMCVMGVEMGPGCCRGSHRNMQGVGDTQAECVIGSPAQHTLCATHQFAPSEAFGAVFPLCKCRRSSLVTWVV
jgi:hypothetical protein